MNGVPTQRELILFNCVLQTTADTGGLQSNNSRIRRMHIILLSYIIYLRFSKIHLVDISMHYACIRVLNIILQMQPGDRTVGVCVSICFFLTIFRTSWVVFLVLQMQPGEGKVGSCVWQCLHNHAQRGKDSS